MWDKFASTPELKAPGAGHRQHGGGGGGGGGSTRGGKHGALLTSPERVVVTLGDVHRRACALSACSGVVVYGVVLRYVFNDAPHRMSFLVTLLLLVISVAMFGASAGVRDAGHIGLDSLVERVPVKGAVLVRKALV